MQSLGLGTCKRDYFSRYYLGTYFALTTPPPALFQNPQKKKNPLGMSTISTVEVESEQRTVHSPHQAQLGNKYAWKFYS
jgi:hypothetical protein